MRKLMAVLVIGGLLCLAGLANAELIVNGDFEAAVYDENDGGWARDIPGWTELEPGTKVYDTPWAPNGPMPDSGEPYTGIWSDTETQPTTGEYRAHGGDQCYGAGNYNKILYLYQNIGTTVGEDYDVTLWAMANGGTGELTVTLDGKSVISISDGGNSSYTQYKATVTAVGSLGTLMIGTKFGGSDAWYIDDVSVTEVVPEPATLSLLALGGLALLRRRRK